MSYSRVSISVSDRAIALIRRHNITVLGQGKDSIVFGHGFGCDQQIWQYVAPKFLTSHKVVLFDYMGCGKSDLRDYDAERYNNLEAYADDLIDLCEALSLENVYFVGHSVSGAIAMLASIKKPELFQKIIAIGPSPHYLNEPPDYFGGFDSSDISTMLEMMDRNYYEWTEYLAPVVIGSAGDDNNIHDLKQNFLRSDPFISKKFAMVTFYCDIRPQLKHISVPVAILYCQDDVVVPIEVVKFLQSNIPNCKVIELNASGHYPQLINPDSVIHAVQKEISNGS